MRYIKRISDGRIIEGSSHSLEETLIKNAISSGYKKDELAVCECDDLEFQLLIDNQTESDKTYREKRATEYPAIGDQLDALFKAGVFPDDMAAQIQAVKDKYPKC